MKDFLKGYVFVFKPYIYIENNTLSINPFYGDF